jgi:hydrogenase expression/formation protein HypC
MCLGIPGEVIDIDRSATPLMGTVSFGGVKKRVCLAWVPEAKVGQYVIVHVGFGLSTMDEEEAQHVFTLLREMDEAGMEESP